MLGYEHSRLRFFCALGWFANINFWVVSRCGFVCLCHAPEKLGGIGSIHQIDGASAKTTAGHPRSKDAGLPDGKINHDIKFRAAYLIVVAKTAVRFGHQWTEQFRLTVLKGLRYFKRASILAEDVAATLVDGFAEQATIILKLRQ